MNQNLKKFTELCLLSRSKGLSEENHKEKINLANKLVEEGVMTIDGNKFYNFTDDLDGKYFSKIINGNQ
jgi:hypothetical protein